MALCHYYFLKQHFQEGNTPGGILMTNIQDIFTLLLETENKYPPKCKIRCRNAQTWSS